MKRIHFLFSHILLLAVVTLTACKQDAKPTGADTTTSNKTATDTTRTGVTEEEAGLVALTAAQYQTVGVKLGRFENRTMSELIRVNGTLTVPPGQQVSVSTHYGGILTSASLLAGTPVRQGQTLAVLENPEFIRIQQEYIETHSQLIFQEQEYERQRELSRENVGSLKTYQQATSQLGMLKARLGGLRQQLALLGLNPAKLTPESITRTIAVRAPIGGTITQVNVNRGRYVAANDVLFEIMNTTGLLAELTVFEGDLARLQVGQRVRLSVVGVAGERMGRIKLINREVGSDRTVKVYAALDNPAAGSLRPGTFLKALIETGAISEPALPETAIVQSGNSSQIYLFVGKEEEEGQTHYQFRSVPVRAGASENGYRAVTLPMGVDTNAQIVLVGAYDILSASAGGDEGGGHDH